MAVMRVRAPGRGDGMAIGRVQVRAWKAAYRGMMAQGFLDGLDEDWGGQSWEGRLAGAAAPTVADLDHDLLVVETAPGADEADDPADIVGVATVGPDRTEPDGGVGELWMINVRPDAWGSGAGSRLLEAAERNLAERGYDRAVLWVLASNTRARRFYERHGWRPDGLEKRSVIGGTLVREVRYVRGDLTPPSRAADA